MTRHQSRESAFVLVFEKMFNGDVDMDEIIAFAKEAQTFELDDFAVQLAKKTFENKDEIDSVINKNLFKWSPERISKVTRAVLRIAVCEILYTDVPAAVAANEAVEISKTYSTEADASFVNGVLSSVIKTVNK